MPFRVYDIVMHDGANPFMEWARRRQKPERAKLDQKLDMLEMYGADLSVGLLSDTSHPHIKKIRINGRVALRPLLCRGPTDMQGEFTLLVGCVERDRKLPPNAIQTAVERRQQLIDGQLGRIKHERIDEEIT